jgi:hypothetical protein
MVLVKGKILFDNLLEQVACRYNGQAVLDEQGGMR